MLRHQLSNPTSVIAAIIEMLEHGDAFQSWPKSDKDYLHQLKRENLRLNNMITNVLSAVTPSNSDDPKLDKATELMPLLNDAAMSCALGAKRLNDIQTNLPNEKLSVIGNSQQLRVAFDNLIENAFRYSEKGTPVIITARFGGKHIHVTIEDKGQGMSVSQQKNLSEMLLRLEGDTAGKPGSKDEDYNTGLGLFVSNLIIERFGGTLKLESSPKQGTKVNVTLLKDYMHD